MHYYSHVFSDNIQKTWFTVQRWWISIIKVLLDTLLLHTAPYTPNARFRFSTRLNHSESSLIRNANCF